MKSLHRFNCTSGESSARSYVSVIIAVNRSEIMLSANLPGGFRYAVSIIIVFFIISGMLINQTNVGRGVQIIKSY